MPQTEVTFEGDEKALLDWLDARVKNDGALAVNDTTLIQSLGLQAEEQRFFRAKMRLVQAGVIGMYLDENNRQVLRLNMPERKKAVSKRYVFCVVPLEALEDVRELIRTRRLADRDRSQDPRPGPTPTAEEAKKPNKWQPPNPQQARSRAQERLGLVQAPAPVRPPLRAR